MEKRLLSLLLAALLCIGSLPAALAGYENFTPSVVYTDGQFTDVSRGDWYAENVRAACELGLINGKSATRYDPEGALTIAEAIKLAAVVHRLYQTGESGFAASTPWYQTYVDYARTNGVVTARYANYDAAATRAQVASIFAAALPDEALPVINDVEDGAIPDVSMSGLYAAAVYKLYRAGVLTGSDDAGSFRPSTHITRGEIAAIVTRMADPSLRKSVSLLVTTATALTSEQLFARCAPAVFYIEVYDAAGQTMATGSGVLLSSTGEAMTNYHVIEDAVGARVKTADGVWHEVTGVYGYDAARDLARLQIAGSGFPYLETSASVNTGATVYAIGSPLGLENTISNGIISAASRMVNGQEYIQTTAAISHGSSGGALIDAYGRLIGITSAYIDGGQSLNLAIPVSDFAAIARGTVTSLASLFGQPGGTAGEACYAGWSVPDFGAYTGTPLFLHLPAETADDLDMYAYLVDEIPASASPQAISNYTMLLQSSGFTFLGVTTVQGLHVRSYYSAAQDEVATIAVGTLQGMGCVLIGVRDA